MIANNDQKNYGGVFFVYYLKKERKKMFWLSYALFLMKVLSDCTSLGPL